MVWRKTWAEREIEYGRDCQAEILSLTSSPTKKFKIRYNIDNTTYEGN
jgi:hypothetical protein